MGVQCLRVQIGPAARKAAAGAMRDLFEAGLNEAAASLAASYGRSSRRGVRNALFRADGGVSIGFDCEVWWVAVAKLGDLAAIFSGSLGDTLVGEGIGGKFPRERSWTGRMSIRFRHRSMVRRLGVMRCRSVGSAVAESDAAMSRRRPFGRRRKGKCRCGCR